MPHGNPDDLQNYEAAVNVRSAALSLNLVPKWRGTCPHYNASPPVSAGAPNINRPSDTAQSQSSVNYDLNVSRLSSSSSVSSLAQAFVPWHLSHVKRAVPPMNGLSISLPVLRMSSVSTCGGSRKLSVTSDGTGSSEGKAFRPLFKCLPSQTLGPANAKCAQLERDTTS